MKKVGMMIVILLMVEIKAFSQTAEDSAEYKGVRFEKELSWGQVKAKAQTENKYIFMDVFATWCGPCKRMDQVVYPDVRAGDAVKDKLIAVKVQMDSTAKDDNYVRNWYADAHNLGKQYNIGGYPSFLFFTPDGRLVHEDGGYKSLGEFIRMVSLATDPRTAQYYNELENYKQGKKDYSTMGGLAVFTKKLIGNNDMAKSIAKDYKENYLDKQNKEIVCTRENLDFIGEFFTLINSNDTVFNLCYHQPAKVDSVMDYKGWADWQVDQTIRRDEIEHKVLKNGKALLKIPEWDKLENTIAQKYHLLDAKKLVLAYQINYYRFLYQDWPLWAKYKDEMIKDYAFTPPYGVQIYANINTYGAWDAFLNCPDKTVLAKALDWIDLALRLADGDKEEKENKSAYLDTKANLLYKLGRKKEALPLEKEAHTISPQDHEITENYGKMEQGAPTWPLQKKDAKR